MNAALENKQTNSQAEHEEYVAPDVNIFENAGGYVLEADMPGVSKDGLEITLDGTELSSVGRRASEAAAGEPVFRERSGWSYRRVFELDPVIATAGISAKIEQGLLTLTLPKSERAKPRKITVE